jgi:outer membrane lipoprotein-sorting protein
MLAVAHPIRLIAACLRYASVLALTILPLKAQSPALNDAFAAMDKVAQQFKGVSANIARDVYTAVIDDHELDMGTMKAKRGKSGESRMRIDFTSPADKVIVLEDTNASVYTPKTKTVQEVEIKRGLVEQFLLLGFGASGKELKEHYDVSLIGAEKAADVNTWHLLLVPKSPEVLKNLKKAELWVSQVTGLPVKEKLYTSTTGDYQLVTYSNVRLNPPLPDSALKLNLPKGVTVEHPRL